MSQPENPAPSAPEAAGRYERSTGGLVGAMLVTLVVIGAFVAFRATVRDDLDVEPEALDYVSIAEGVRGAGFDVVYPDRLPPGWKATSATDLSVALPWQMGILTTANTFIGIALKDASVSDLVEENIDKNAAEGDEVTLPGTIRSPWRSFSDGEGDVGYATEISSPTGDLSLLVWGDAGADELREMIKRLVVRRAL